MDINIYRENTDNLLKTIQPEWSESAEPHSPINLLRNVLAMLYPLVDDANIQAINNANVFTADDQHLIRAQGSMNKVFYKGGTKTRYNLVVNCNSNGVIQTPFQVQDVISGQTYSLMKNAEVFVGNNTLTFECDDVGVITSNINNITRIMTPNAIVNSVNNPTQASYIGEDPETQEAYRIRVESEQMSGNSVNRNIKIDLINKAGCSRANVIYNPTANIDGFVRPYSYAIITYGGDEEAIYDVISKYRLVEEMSYSPDETRNHTSNVIVDSGNIGDREIAGSSLFVGYTEALVKTYYAKIQVRNLNQSYYSSLKSYILSYLRNNVIEDFQKKIQASVINYAVQRFISENALTQSAVVSVLLSYDNVEYVEEIEPSAQDELLFLVEQNIIIENVE